jgi:DNA-directed RNA polymerase specialized sigma24 family protein
VRGDDELSFRRFLADRRPALLRTALLLTGDRTTAESLVQAVLARASRRWRRLVHDGDPSATVLGSLAATATRRRTSLLRAEQVIECAAEPGAPVGNDGFARALRELPPRTRAVVVLRYAEGLSAAATAKLLSCPLGTVTTETVRGLDRLRRALPPGGYTREPVDDDLRVQEELTRLAAAPGRWQLDTEDALVDVHRRVGSARRRLAGAVAAAVCVPGIAVPLARAVPDAPAAAVAAASPSPTAPTSSAATSKAPVAPPTVPVLVGPPRGSLAGDAAFLAAVRQVGWGAQEAPPPQERDVVYAGDTPDGRVALVVGTVLEDVRGVWLTGPVGAPPETLRPHVPAGLGRNRPLSLVLGGPGPATLVVVAGRTDRVEVSDRLQTGPRGTVSRSYQPVEAVGGVAVVPVRTTARGTATSVRVLRDGTVVDRSGVDWLPPTGPAAAGTAPAELPDPAPLRPTADPPDDRLVATALVRLAIPLAVEPQQLAPRLLWSGRLPGTPAGSVAVVLAHSPGGALVVGTYAGGPGGAVTCGVSTPPGTADVDGLMVARTCDVPTSGSADPRDARWLLITAPGAAASAEVLDARAGTLATVPLAGGGGLVPLPDGARTVRTADAAGEVLTEVPVAPMAVVPFGDFGPGPQG